MPLGPLPETSGLVAGNHLPSKHGVVKFWFLTIGDRASTHGQDNNQGTSSGRIVAEVWAISMGSGENFRFQK